MKCRTGLAPTIAGMWPEVRQAIQGDVGRSRERCARISATDSGMRNSTDWSRRAQMQAQDMNAEKRTWQAAKHFIALPARDGFEHESRSISVSRLLGGTAIPKPPYFPSNAQG
jgi:hypothetical protein